MINISERILNKKVAGIYNNFFEQTLIISFFEDDCILKLGGCVIVFDLGMIGHIISFVSDSCTLGMALELKRMKLDPDEYNYLLLYK